MREEFIERIVAEAEGVARLYLYGKEIGQPATREQKEFIEGIVATDYDGRTVIELLQNGHDAHPADRKDGQLEFLLREDEGAYGVLYAANGGAPVGDEDFTAMCRVAMSSKRPDEGIGNKGVGFKSVLQLADSPEVYSADAPGAAGFGGYCFRFARPEDYEDLARRVAPGQQGLAAELRENVASLKVPVPLPGPVPPVVSDFGEAGFATVVRLVLRSPEACRQARQQLDDLASSSGPPFHLFLKRVATIKVTRVAANGAVRPTTNSRDSKCIAALPGVAVDEVVLQDGHRFTMLRCRVPEAYMKDAITRSRTDGRISAGWDRWQGDGEVSVAFPVGDPLTRGRMYTFLPMGEDAVAPLAGFVNAPFFARLDRRSLDAAIPLNNLLLDRAAALCARAAQLAVSGELPLPPGMVVDMVTWQGTALQRLAGAFDALGEAIADFPFIPALGRHPRAAISAAWVWGQTGQVFTPQAVAAAGVDDIIDPALGAVRLQRLRQFASELGMDLAPGEGELALWAEALATSLAAGPLDLRAWADFYDLAASVTSGASLAGRRVILDDRAAVIPARSGRDISGPVVFFAPQPGDDRRTAGEGPPSAVAGRLAFTHPGIPWRSPGPAGRTRQGRSWLEKERLVREYRTDAVLSLVGSVMRDAASGDDVLLRSCLWFAFELWRGRARDVAADVVADARLLVPAAEGWRPADGSLFGTGWPGPDSTVDALLARLLSRAPGLSGTAGDVADCVIPGPQDLGAESEEDTEELRLFLEHAGVRHGLVPSWLPAGQFRLRGSQVLSPLTAPDFPASVPAEQQKLWRDVAARWPRQAVVRSTAECEPATGVAVLPGQFGHEALDPDSRRLYAELILHGLAWWPAEALELGYRRHGDYRPVAWPTPLAAFLATADWIPQTTPGQRTEVTYLPAAQAWWLGQADTPDYIRAQPAALRNLATEPVLGRLKMVGVRRWDDPATAAGRLAELTSLASQARAGGRGQPGLAIRKAYEQAWQDLIHSGAPVPAAVQAQVLAMRAGRLVVAPAGEDAETVYVPVESGITQERLLQQAPVPMLAIRDRKLADQIHQLLASTGTRCLRRTADARVEVTIDAMPAALAPRTKLLDATGSWLTTLVLSVIEFCNRAFPATTPAQLADAAQRLETAMLTTAQAITTSIDGHQIAGDTSTSVLISNDDSPQLVVTGMPGTPAMALLQPASQALAELAGMPGLADSLRLALIDLQRRCPGSSPPGPADIAAVLGVTTDDVTALAAEQASWQVTAARVIAVLACLDITLAEELQGVLRQLGSPAALRQWLTSRLATQGRTPDEVLTLADGDDLLAAVRAFGTTLAEANLAFRALDLPPLHNRDGHAQQFAAYLQRHRHTLHDRIRDAFTPAYQSRQPLDDYLRLRELPGLGPDDAWLDQYWDVPKDILAGHAEAWLHRSLPQPAEDPGLHPVEESREANRRRLRRILGRAAAAADAWLHRHAHGSGQRPAGPATVTDMMTQAGVLDFGPVTTAAVADWLKANGQWPAGMPTTTRLAELELTAEDITEARQRLRDARTRQDRASVTIRLDARDYRADTGLIDLADAVRASITPQLLNSPGDLPALLPPTDVPSARPDRKDRGPGGTWTPGQPPEVLKAIGLAGEVAAGEWLRHHFGVPPEDSWVSGYRNLLIGDGDGDDSLGYDFRIIAQERTRLFEVKATTTDITEFTLGETEVRTAQNLSPDEEYVILFITRVLDSQSRRIIPLPNPFAPGGLSRYRIAGHSVRLQFQLGPC